MPFPWSKRNTRVAPVQPQKVVLPVSAEVLFDTEAAAPAAPHAYSLPSAAEIFQEVILPLVDDKISSIEHKNGEQVADARKEDDEDHEIQGLVQEGGRSEEGNHGGEEDVEEARRR